MCRYSKHSPSVLKQWTYYCCDDLNTVFVYKSNREDNSIFHFHKTLQNTSYQYTDGIATNVWTMVYVQYRLIICLVGGRWKDREERGEGVSDDTKILLSSPRIFLLPNIPQGKYCQLQRITKELNKCNWKRVWWKITFQKV